MLNAEEIMAVVKSFSSSSKEYKAARADLDPGEYSVDTVVRVQGTLKVAENTDKASTSTILNEEFLSLVLHHAGVTRERAAEVISMVASEYMQDWDGSKEAKKEAKKARKERVKEYDPEGKISGIFADVKESIPRTPVKGKVTFAGSCEQVFSDSVESSIEIGDLSDATDEEVA